MLLTNMFPTLFRRENYAHQLALYDDPDLANPFETILRRVGIDGIWDREYSVIPVGRMGGRNEAEPIPILNLTEGYVTYGALRHEVSGAISMSKHMKIWAKKFGGTGGKNPEASFAGYLADAGGRSILARSMLNEHEFFAQVFNLGAIQAGNAFFDQNARAEGLPDVPASNFIYDGVPLFTFADNPHIAFATASTIGPTGSPTGTAAGASLTGAAGTTGAAITDTGGYFNAFTLPPSYWALKRVMQHMENNMSFDEQDVQFSLTPNVLLISSFNEAHWREVLDSKFVAYTQTNTENVFQEKNGRFRLQLVVSRLLIRNTWFIGKMASPGILRVYPNQEDDPWSYWREERNRTYFVSYERSFGMWIRNWRYWCGGSVSVDGVTAPEYGDYTLWEAGVL